MRIKNILIVITLFFLFIVFKPVDTYALVEKSSYINIEDKLDMEVADYLSVSLGFTTNKFSYINVRPFGLKGSIKNKTFYDKNYSIKIFYYDENYNLIVEDEAYKKAKAKCDNCATYDLVEFMINIDKVKDKDISKITYYMVEIDVDTNSPNINSNYNYTINKYDINIKVNKDNTYDIEEKIIAYFNIPKHGIIRTIPYKNEVIRLDNTKTKNIAKLTNLYVNNPYTLNNDNRGYVIQIGSSSNTIEGEKEYIIKYNYNIGNDKSKKYDEFYYNIIGTDWDTQISDITFMITMPKEFDESKLGFSKGEYGSVNTSDIEYKVDNNIINGSYKGILNPYEGLTIRLELPDGYFVKQKIDLRPYIIYLVPIICLIISIVIYFVLKNGINLVEPVEFYPPLGLNSLDVGLYYKGKAGGKEISSLLIYLANRGYLKINELDKKDYKEKGKFEIIKLKEELPDNGYEISFLDYLFDGKDIVNEKTLVKKFKTLKTITLFNNILSIVCYTLFVIGMITLNINLILISIIVLLVLNSYFQYKRKSYDNLYSLYATLEDINSEWNTSKILRNKKRISMIINILIWISILAIIIKFNINLSILIILLFVHIISIKFLKQIVSIRNEIPIIGYIFISVFVVPILMFYKNFLLSNIYDSLYILLYIMGLICILGMIIVDYKIIWRTPYGYEMLGKIKGFKRFLKTAEKDKLNTLVESNPNYFYDILPYTYVLGVSNKWIKKFNKIPIENPNLYSPSLINEISSFENLVDISVSSFYYNKSNRSTPSNYNSSCSSDSFGSSGGGSSHSNGGSSGGGSSGGGSGGGGGSSW